VLKCAYLPDTENLQLQEIMKREYLKIDYLCFVNEIMFYLKAPYENTMLAANSLFFIINKILLDNVFKYTHTKNTTQLYELLQTKNFALDVYINPFYTTQFLEDTGIQVSLEDKCEVENVLTKRVYKYITDMYRNDPDNFNNIIIQLHEHMYNNFNFVNISYYKFELMNYRNPMLLYTEKNNAEHAYCQ
jgi:hypothetical protein